MARSTGFRSAPHGAVRSPSATVGPRVLPVDIYCISRSARQNTSQVTWLQCDLFDKSQLEKCLEEVQPRVLIHLAWDVTPKKFWEAEENIAWLYHSVNLFRTFLKYGGKIFIGAGSIAEYDLSKPILQGTLPNTLYGSCKFCLRHLIFQLKTVLKSQIKIIWPQIGWPFGVCEPQEKFFSQIFYKVLNNQDITLVAKNLALPYLYDEHVGLAIAKCMECSTDAVFPLCALTSIKLEEIIEQIAHALNKTYRLKYATAEMGKLYKLDTAVIPSNIKKYLQADISLDIDKFLTSLRNRQNV